MQLKRWPVQSVCEKIGRVFDDSGFPPELLSLVKKAFRSFVVAQVASRALEFYGRCENISAERMNCVSAGIGKASHIMMTTEKGH